MVTPEVTFADLSRDPHAVAHQVYDSPTESIRIRTRSQEEDDLVLLTARHAEDVNTAATAMTRLLVGLTPEALFGVLPHAFPWVRYLPVQEQRSFAADLVTVLRAAESAGNPALVVQRIVEWRHTAEIHADPRLLAILQQDGQDLGEVPRP